MPAINSRTLSVRTAGAAIGMAIIAVFLAILRFDWATRAGAAALALAGLAWLWHPGQQSSRSWLRRYLPVLAFFGWALAWLLPSSPGRLILGTIVVLAFAGDLYMQISYP